MLIHVVILLGKGQVGLEKEKRTPFGVITVLKLVSFPCRKKNRANKGCWIERILTSTTFNTEELLLFIPPSLAKSCFR